jgi:hypothetical protein
MDEQTTTQPNALEKEVETPAILPYGTKTGLPLDIVLSLLRPNELEKLRTYIIAYGQASCRHAE